MLTADWSISFALQFLWWKIWNHLLTYYVAPSLPALCPLSHTQTTPCKDIALFSGPHAVVTCSMENLIPLEFVYCLHISIHRSLHSNRSLSCFRYLRDVILITEGKAWGDYRCIQKVSKQLRDLLEYNNWLRLWVISFSFSVWNTNFWWGVHWVLETSLSSKIKAYYT